MDEFDIPVKYKGDELVFSSKLLAYTYSYKIQVDVNETVVLFERDDERNLRAIISPDTAQDDSNVDVELLKCISSALEGILK